MVSRLCVPMGRCLRVCLWLAERRRLRHAMKLTPAYRTQAIEEGGLPVPGELAQRSEL